MENCLTTQLKGTVQNDNLLKIGDMVVQVKKSLDANVETSIKIAFNVESTITPRGNGLIGLSAGNLSSNPVTIPANTETQVFLSNDDYDIVISNKYNIIRLEAGRDNNSICVFDLAELKYCSLLSLRLTGNHIGSFNDVTTNQLYINSNTVHGNVNLFTVGHTPTGVGKYFVLAGENIEGNIGKIANATDYVFNVTASKITGDISQLAICSSATNIAVAYSDVYGTVESVVDVIKEQKDTGTLLFIATGSNVTYNGNPFRRVTYNFATGQYDESGI